MTGISFESREWVNIIYDLLNRTKTINDITHIYGKDYPEVYNNFKVDIWVITNSNRIEYDHYKSGYYGDEYVVFLNIPLIKLVRDMLVHEIKHAYEDWNRIINGGKPMKDTWEIKNIYTKDFETLVLGKSVNYPRLGGLIKLYYLSSKLETPAYLENEYDNPNLAKYRDIGKTLRDYDTDRFYKRNRKLIRGLDSEFNDLIKDNDIPLFNKFKNVEEFIKYSKKRFNHRGRDIVKRVDRMVYTLCKEQKIII